jgi:PKD repeat protein
VEENNSNMELEELFRSKLENSELIPGEGVRTNLMRKLARKEFLRFNPSRFNIYYMGGIVAAAVAVSAAIILGTGHSASTSKNTSQPVPDKEVVALTANVQATDSASSLSDKNSQVRQVEIKGNQPVAAQAAPEYRLPESKINIKENVAGNNTAGRSDTPLKTDVIMKKLTAENVSGYQLQKKTIASFEVSASSGCLPLRVKFSNLSADWDSCRWIFGDGGNSTETDPVWLFDVAGEYKVVLKVYGSGGTESYSEKILNVYHRPRAVFEIEPQAPIIPDDPIRFINYSRDAVKYRWEFGDGIVSEAFEPEHKYSKYGSYNVRLIAWSEHGCSDSLLLTDAFAGSGCFIDFPNAFIPNTDGPSGGYYSTKSDEAAQIFHPVTSGVSEYQLRIFSKTGILIFESNDINTGWDGYHKGQLCETGVYIWKVRGTYKNGEPFVKMGDITLLKR